MIKFGRVCIGDLMKYGAQGELKVHTKNLHFKRVLLGTLNIDYIVQNVSTSHRQ